MHHILLVEDRESLRHVYATYLRGQGHGVAEAEDVERARALLQQNQFDLILTDYMLPGVTGLDFLSEIKAQDEQTPVVVMTAFGEVKLAVETMRRGAFDFLEKPIDLGHLGLVVSRALDHRGLLLQRGLAERKSKGNNHEAIAAKSPAMIAALEAAGQVAPGDTTCLLLGETGVGKEVMARYIHQHSKRADGPLVALNCASIPGELMESELFGHERGAFTGADGRKAGLVEMAAGGTLFLDEIGELSLDLQPKLLRFIQEREFTRLGGTRVIKSDVRVIGATNRDLQNGIGEGWFREDLYYRLAVFPIQIPPLRERLDDLPELIHIFLQRNGVAKAMDADLVTKLSAYSWPGNIRELENLVERACILARGGPLSARHFPENLFSGERHRALHINVDLQQSLKANMAMLETEVERHMIAALLREEDGKRAPVAQRLGVSVKTLYNKMQRHGLI